MPYLAWDDCFSVGIPRIDQHHQYLFSLFNKLYDALISNTYSQQDMALLFDQLIDYTIYHFASEEHWMQENRFTDLDIHKKEHAVFAQNVVEMDKNFLCTNRHQTIEVLVFLNDWLQAHILKSDAEFGRFMNTDGSVTTLNIDSKITSS